MRLWKFLVCMVIITAISIWGCASIINTPDNPDIEIPFSSILEPELNHGFGEHNI